MPANFVFWMEIMVLRCSQNDISLFYGSGGDFPFGPFRTLDKSSDSNNQNENYFTEHRCVSAEALYSCLNHHHQCCAIRSNRLVG